MLRRVVVLMILSLAFGSSAAAQPPDAAQRGRGATGGPEGPPPGTPRATAELVGMLDTYAIVQAQKALELPDDQYARFIPRLRKLQETRRRNQQMRNKQVAELRRLVGPRATGAVDENLLRDALKALRDHDERAATELRAAYLALDEVLDVRQQARFRVFEEHIENRKLDLLLRARARASQRGTARQ